MKKSIKKWLFGIILSVIILVIIGLMIFLFSDLTLPGSLRVVFGSVYVLFIPGFVLSYVFFPKTKPFEEDDKDKINKSNIEKSEKGAIDWIERVALSFALSIAVVPLAVFYLNLMGVKINLINSFFTILGIILISLTILIFKANKN